MLVVLAGIGLIPYKLVLSSAAIATIAFVLQVTMSKRRRRDFMAVVIEAWKFDKEERDGLL